MPKNVLLVVAHPDDETLLFLPTIFSLVQSDRLYLLCLSVGDFEGLGQTRKRELQKSCSLLGINDFHIVEDERLKDGPDENWDHFVIASLVQNFVKENCIDEIITFDESGVSGHPNHKAIFHGINHFLQQKVTVTAFKLISTNILRKYVGILDILYSITSSSFNNHKTFISLNIFRNIRIMKQHRSQFVWYRLLFILFSRYSFINTLQQFG